MDTRYLLGGLPVTQIQRIQVCIGCIGCIGCIRCIRLFVSEKNTDRVGGASVFRMVLFASNTANTTKIYGNTELPFFAL